jgi:hypothetical protein
MKLIQELQNAQRAIVWYQAEHGFGDSCAQSCGAVLCGSFNPLHDGHRQLASSAGRFLGESVSFEMSIRNVEKPALDIRTIVNRCEQFETQAVVLTNAPTFVEKSAVLSGKTFIVGADTAMRIVDAGFYGDQNADMLRALDTIRWNGCRFVVAGRTIGDRFFTLSEIAIPRTAEDLFVDFPADQFRLDLSSSKLRETE